MNYYRIIAILALIFCLATPAAASDIQQGIHGMKWGSSISEHDELTKVHEVNQTAYYARSKHGLPDGQSAGTGRFLRLLQGSVFCRIH